MNDEDIKGSKSEAETLAELMSRWDVDNHDLAKGENKSYGAEKKLDQDMIDLVEYTKWVSKEAGVLRDRVRAAEKVISELKSSGESSVEAIMESLFLLKVRQAELDK